jgi:hypothetical protein
MSPNKDDFRSSFLRHSNRAHRDVPASTVECDTLRSHRGVGRHTTFLTIRHLRWSFTVRNRQPRMKDAILHFQLPGHRLSVISPTTSFFDLESWRLFGNLLLKAACMEYMLAYLNLVRVLRRDGEGASVTVHSILQGKAVRRGDIFSGASVFGPRHLLTVFRRRLRSTRPMPRAALVWMPRPDRCAAGTTCGLSARRVPLELTGSV